MDNTKDLSATFSVNSAADRLLSEVFNCEHCAQLGVFTRSQINDRFYKFPPIIGKHDQAEVLFIGINPRRSCSNERLHDWLMASRVNFAKFASNRLESGRQYICINGEEEHYHPHMMVIDSVYGKGAKFEEVAAVTELYLCANESGSALLHQGKSPCAERYLERVIRIAKPAVVVAVGSGVFRQLNQHFRATIGIPIVRMDHPRELRNLREKEKSARLNPTIAQLAKILGRL